MKAQIKRMRHNNFVRFFSDYVVCEHCGQDTRGRCYAETEQVVCSKCKGVLLDASDVAPSDGMMIVTFIPGRDDDV